MKKVLWFSFLLLFVGCLGPGMFAQELVYTQDIDGKEFKSQSFPFFQYPVTDEIKKKLSEKAYSSDLYKECAKDSNKQFSSTYEEGAMGRLLITCVER